MNALHHLRQLADGPIPDFKPKLPAELADPSATLLSWTAGAGLSLATLAALLAWGLSAYGEMSDRPGMAAKAKRGILVALIAGLGIGMTSSGALIMVFYDVGA